MTPPRISAKYAKLDGEFDLHSNGVPDISVSEPSESLLSKESDTVFETGGNTENDTEHESESYSDSQSFVDTGSSSFHAEGSSSNLASTSDHSPHHQDPNTDLELQRPLPPTRLSARLRMLGVVQFLFPVRQTYERLSNGIATGRLQANTPGRFVGQGTDGVFRNLMAKPDTELNRVLQEQHPPTYEEAAADATPEYWESTMISPMYEDEVFVQGLPVGNVANFVWNLLVTVAFQLVGFILCYLLHTSHAAKQGTRAGLGITILMYGYSVIPVNFGLSDRIPVRYEPDDPNLIDISALSSVKSSEHVDKYVLGLQLQQDSASLLAATKTPYLAYGLIAFGIFIVIKSVVDYFKVKQAEKEILAPQRRQETHTVTDSVDEHNEEEP